MKIERREFIVDAPIVAQAETGLREIAMECALKYEIATPEARALVIRAFRNEAKRSNDALGKWYSDFADALEMEFG